MTFKYVSVPALKVNQRPNYTSGINGPYDTYSRKLYLLIPTLLTRLAHSIKSLSTPFQKNSKVQASIQAIKHVNYNYNLFTNRTPKSSRELVQMSSPCSRSNWNLEMLVFEERGKPG